MALTSHRRIAKATAGEYAMRIQSVRIVNFRGIERAELDGLGNAPLITVSGPNGAGKSIFFEAIALMWRLRSLWERRQVVPSALIGPWGDQAQIDVGVVLSDDETATISEYVQRAGAPVPESGRIELGVAITHRESPLELRGSNGALALWTPDFTSSHPFANIDYFPADRAFPRGEHAAVNPALLSEQQREAFREQIVGSFAQQRQMVNLSGIAPLLASLDYVDLLADRDGLPRSGDFDALANAFAAATSKVLMRPTLDPGSAYGSALRVRTPTGLAHGIDQLSSGEQEVLGLMYFVRRLNARGGILLIDEPELHLHPSLQRALFSAMEDTAARAQVWIATHSSRLITAAPLEAIVHIRPALGDGSDQTARASDETDRMRVLEDLGVHPIEAFQSDAFVVVEGSTDEQRLSAFLPEFGRVFVFVAGGGAQVEHVVRMLNSEDLPAPHIGIRDRDEMTDDQVAELQRDLPNLFVWTRRSLENELLWPPLIVRTLHRAGRVVSEEAVIEQLRRLSDQQRDTVLARHVEARLTEEHSYSRSGDTPLDRQRHHLAEVRRVADAKLSAFDRVAVQLAHELDEQWPEEFLVLADGKRLISEYVQHTGFRTLRDFVSALAQTAHDHPDVAPPALLELRERLHEILPSTTTVP